MPRLRQQEGGRSRGVARVFARLMLLPAAALAVIGLSFSQSLEPPGEGAATPPIIENSAASSDTAKLRVISPTNRTIVYGPTQVVLEGPADLLYRVYWRRAPGEKGALICRSAGPPAPGTCVFDAGTNMSSETILVEAANHEGDIAQSETVETYFFQEPEVTVKQRSNPIIDAGILGGDSDIEQLIEDPGSIDCTLGGRPCEVRSIRRRMSEGKLRISLLIDESASVGREGLEQLKPAIRAFVRNVQEETSGALVPEFEIAFFSEQLRLATYGFTSDLDRVEQAIATGTPSGGTCLFKFVANRLQHIYEKQLTDRYAGRKTSYALIVWSDGQNACPGGQPFCPAGPCPEIDESEIALQEARLSESPVFIVPLPLGPDCQGGCLPSSGFTDLGRMSGGASYGAAEVLPDLLNDDIFRHLMSRYDVEIEPETFDLLDRNHFLKLTPKTDVTLRYRAMLSPSPPKRMVAERILRNKRSGIEAKAVAADIISKEPGSVRAPDLERIYEELRKVIFDISDDLAVQARELGKDELADILKARRHRMTDFLAKKELSIVRVLSQPDRERFMESRNAILEAIITLTGRGLLWLPDSRAHSRILELHQQLREQGYRLAHSDSRLSVFLSAYLDPDFPGRPELRTTAKQLLEP